MPAGLCAEKVVETVPLPRLIATDTPVSEDLPRFVEELAQALTRQLARVAECAAPRQIACRLAPLSWEGVFDRVAAEYRELAGLSPATR